MKGPHPQLIAVDGALGAGIQSSEGEWPGIGLVGTTFLVRPSWFTVGAGVDMEGTFFGPTQEFLGALGGGTFQVTRSFRIDALAELGVHLEQPNTGLELFSEDEIVGGDTSFALPYAGVRLGPAFEIGGRKGPRFLIGLWLNAREDLARETITYTVESCGSGLFGGEYSCSLHEESYRAGGAHLTAGLRLGATFGRRIVSPAAAAVPGRR